MKPSREPTASKLDASDRACAAAGMAVRERVQGHSASRRGEEQAQERIPDVEHDAHRLRNGLIWTGALAALLLAIGLAVPDLRQVLDRATGAGEGWLALAVGLEVLSCLGYVAIVRLVLRKAPKREARWLAWAEMAFGAVVPIGGAGGLAVGAWAMRAWGVTWSRIANRSAVIFLFTSAVNVSVLTIAGVGVWLGIGSHKSGAGYGLIPAGVAFGALAFFLLLPVAWARRTPRRRLGIALQRIGTWVGDSEALLKRPDWRLLGAPAYLLSDIAVLWMCLRALGVHAPVFALIAGYQIGYLANLLPVPGGLGVLEGGLLGALLLYGLPAAPTAAAVVLYHAISLWVPTIGGTIGFLRLRGSVGARVRRPLAFDPEAASGSARSVSELAASRAAA